MNSGPQLAVGARGRDVQRVQTIFVMMKTLGFDQIDGVFGTLTRNAVVAFQEARVFLPMASLATAPGSGCPRTQTRPS
jgi:peptidoglycan hydrolase-like protein with peptidoglycan-binding domain